MKKWLTPFLITTCLLGTSISAAQAISYDNNFKHKNKLVTKVDAFNTVPLHVRTGPGKHYTSLRVLPQHTALNLGNCTRYWCEVYINDGLALRKQGWSSLPYLALRTDSAYYNNPKLVHNGAKNGAKYQGITQMHERSAKHQQIDKMHKNTSYYGAANVQTSYANVPVPTDKTQTEATDAIATFINGNDYVEEDTSQADATNSNDSTNDDMTSTTSSSLVIEAPQQSTQSIDALTTQQDENQDEYTNTNNGQDLDNQMASASPMHPTPHQALTNQEDSPSIKDEQSSKPEVASAMNKAPTLEQCQQHFAYAFAPNGTNQTAQAQNTQRGWWTNYQRPDFKGHWGPRWWQKQ